MQPRAISERPLVVKCSYGPRSSNKQIKFTSVRNCTYDILQWKVSQCYSLPLGTFFIQYKDHDNEYCIVKNDIDLADAVEYFRHGDDSSLSSAVSTLSGRSIGSRRIVIRVNVCSAETLNLSDSSSLASLEEYQGRNQSQLSFDGRLQSQLDDDSATVSSRDVLITPYQQTPRGSSRDPSNQSKLRSPSSGGDCTSSSGSVNTEDSVSLSGSISLVDTSTSGSFVSGRQSDEYLSAVRRYPADVSEALGKLEIQDQARTRLFPSPDHGSASSRSKAWLQDQSEHHIRSKLGSLPQPSTVGEGSVDLRPDSEIKLSKITQVPPPRQNPHGNLYYDYSSLAGSSSSSHAHDSGFEETFGVRDDPDNDSLLEQKPRVSSMNLSWLEKQRINQHHEPGPLLQPPHAQWQNSEPFSNSHEFPQIDPETPPEVLQFVTVRPPLPNQLTNCSGCGILLDLLRYVCRDCGEKSPMHYTVDKGKGKSTNLNGSASHQYHHSASPDISLPYEFASSSYDIPHKPLPNPPSSLSTASSSTLSVPEHFSHHSYERGYELCARCLDEAGIAHAIDAGEPPTTSTTWTSNSPSSPDASGWTRSAPKHKGQMRHSFIEKSWGHEGWVVVEQSGTKCSTCKSSIQYKQHYKCFSCQLDLCRLCYSQVHSIDPTHAFLYIFAKPQPSSSEPDLLPPDVDNLADEPSLKHLDVKCAYCNLDIVGARFHCVVCESFDICSKCESAGPFSLVSSDGGHLSSHIMIKLPYPVESNEIQNVSRKALNLWNGRDAATFKPSTRQRTTSLLSTSDVQTVIAAGTGRMQSLFAARNHQVSCNSCGNIIIGIRYQCAVCPSISTAFSLCETCEVTSYKRHDPLHFFFKLPRPLNRPLKLSERLPIIYTVPVGSMIGSPTRNPTDYLKHLRHNNAICDMCMMPIQGAWFRCAYCGKDLCDACEELDDHDDSHVFLVFKSTVDHNLLRHITDLETPTLSPVIPYPVYQ